MISGVLVTLISRVLVTLACALLPELAWAHPMGNFSVSHYSALHIGEDTVELRYVLDMAEIPTFQEIQETGIVPEVGHPSLGTYLKQKADTLAQGLRLEIDGRRAELRVMKRDVIFPPGAGGLATLKLRVVYRVVAGERAGHGLRELRFRDENLPDRAGWKEIIAVAGAGVTLVSSSAPERDRSAELNDYPTDPLSNPPQELEARVTFARVPHGLLARVPSPPPASPADISAPVATAAGAVALQPNRQSTPRNALTEMLTRPQMGVTIVFLAGVVAMGLGALHALEPGHGKTVVAAYLVGSRGTAWHALLLGVTVTASHTAGVYLLGALTLYASRYVVPERLYPWLTAGSGLLIAAIGVVLFWRRYSGAAHDHSHEHTHDHEDEHTHHHHHGHHHHVPSGVRLRDLIALGVSGGIVPCPAALVVLLSAFAMRRTGFGLFLIVAFSVGLAAVLVAVGLVIVYARQLMARFRADGVLITRWLPLTSAAVVTLLGVAIAVQAR